MILGSGEAGGHGRRPYWFSKTRNISISVIYTCQGEINIIYVFMLDFGNAMHAWTK